jgi:hypothetical protein
MALEIEWISHRKIDKEFWDRFITESNECYVYALSWYLDIIFPGWSAVYIRKNNQIIAVCPVPVERKLYFFKTIRQPYLGQQSGVFSCGPQDHQLFPELIEFLKSRFQYIDYHFNCSNTQEIDNLPDVHPLFTPRITHHLSLDKSYEELWKGYSENQRRSVKKAIKNKLSCSLSSDIENLIHLFREGKALEISKVREIYYNRIKDIYHSAKQRSASQIYQVCGEDGKPQAAALFITYKTKVIYLFAASTQEGKETGAMAFLLDQFIKDHSNNNLILDFEGSNIPSLARFYKGFGGIEKIYLRMQKFIFKL